MSRGLRSVVILLSALLASASSSSRARPATLDATAPPGANYERAEFRLWYPEEAGRLRALVILVPGSNEDGRAQVEDPFWRDLARRHGLGLVACHFTDKPHEQMFIEQYADVSKGSGQALLDALRELAGRASHPEIAQAPLLLWGMSAGGEFNYELVAWKPERVIAFVVNKGNVYYTALAPAAARAVPGVLFIGERDLEFRNRTIVGLFALNRRAGALWALAEEPGVAHEVGRSRDLAAVFFEEALALRLPAGTSTPRALAEETGFYGDLETGLYQPVRDAKAPERPVAWLLSDRVARAWRAVVTGRPVDPSE
jgi:poly(3-hydroxybutyrate) depolymerase